MVCFISCEKTPDAIHIAQLFYQEVVYLYELPKTIVFYCNSKFLSHFRRNLWERLAMTLAFRERLDMSLQYSTCHPHTNGDTDINNRTMKSILCSLIEEHPKE